MPSPCENAPNCSLPSVQRCMLVATKKLHVPCLAWIADRDKNIHIPSLHILSEVIKFSSKEYNGGVGCRWADDVCESIISLGGVRLIMEKMCPTKRGKLTTDPKAIRSAAIILTFLAIYSEQISAMSPKKVDISHMITTGSCSKQDDPPPANAVSVIQLHADGNYGDYDDLPIACSQLLVALSNNEENCRYLAQTDGMLKGLLESMDTHVREVQKNIFEALANLSLNSNMKIQMSEFSNSINSSQAARLGEFTVVQNVTAALGKHAAVLPDEYLVPLVRIIANVTVDVNSHEDLVPRRRGTMQRSTEEDDIDSQEWRVFLETVGRVIETTKTQDLQLELVRLLRNEQL